MGILLTTLYIACSHLSPAEMAPELIPYRPLVWLTVFDLIAALVGVVRYSYPFRAPQNVLLIGLFAVIVFSSAIEAGSAGLTFRVLSVSTKSDGLFSVRRDNSQYTSFVAPQRQPDPGCAVHGRVGYTRLPLGTAVDVFVFVWPPLEEQVAGQFLERRVRGLGFLNDPNDFAQFLLVVVPFIWLAWRKGSTIRNLVIVVIPTLAIMWTVLLTQSGGTVLRIWVLLLFALRRRVGLAASLTLTVLLLIGVIAIGGLRRGDVWVHENLTAGRIEAWGNGVAMWKSSPLWGVGFGQFGDTMKISRG